MRICFTELEGWEEGIIRRELEGFELTLTTKSVNELPPSILKDIDVLSTFIYSKVNRDLLLKMKKLKLIVTRSTGFDHIDLDACRELGITVCNIPEYGTNTVAEFTFLLILALMRKFKRILKAVEEGKFSVIDLRGHDLRGKTIGIIGTGRIGSYVARLAHAFDMKILGYDIVKRDYLVKNYGVKYVDLKTLLSNSDIVTLHLPLTKDTYHIINRETLKYVKKGAIIVNTARGALIDTEALIEALNEGIISGAALDVVEAEELMYEDIDVILHRAEPKTWKILLANQYLIRHPNVILTPHIAYNTWEALQRILKDTLETIRRFQVGEKLRNRIV